MYQIKKEKKVQTSYTITNLKIFCLAWFKDEMYYSLQCGIDFMVCQSHIVESGTGIFPRVILLVSFPFQYGNGWSFALPITFYLNPLPSR